MGGIAIEMPSLLGAASKDGREIKESACCFKELRNVACGALAVWAVAAASPVIAAGQVGYLLFNTVSLVCFLL